MTVDLELDPITVLLAEDDLDIRDVVQDLLEEIGCDVIPCRTGKQALDFLANDPRAPPDLVILDLMMPLVTGWQVLEVIQRDPKLAKIPVVILTAATQDRPSGVAALLHKPFQIQTLIDTVQRLRSRAA
ncbi:MAG TPA: response regulator [Polyangia bacterium]